jgi:hypothetical protein
MKGFSAVRRFRVSQLLAFVFAVALSLPVSAHESEIKTPDPGFRPYSQNTPAFLEALDTTTIAVYPSLVRRANRTAHSFASQSQIIAFLNAENIATAVAAPYRIDLGALPQVPQWDLFQNDMWRIAYLLTDHQFDAEYHLFMEFLFPVNNQAVFGIECYVLDRNGENAFSFLLNSHHQLFVDAKLVANNSSEAARAKLLEKATQVGVTAFKRQLEQAKESAAATAEKGPTDLRDGP